MYVNPDICQQKNTHWVFFACMYVYFSDMHLHTQRLISSPWLPSVCRQFHSNVGRQHLQSLKTSYDAVVIGGGKYGTTCFQKTSYKTC